MKVKILISKFDSFIRSAWDEVCVLLDCLTVARADRLMFIDMEKKHVSLNEEKLIEVSDKTLSLVLKKRVNIP